MAAKPKPGRPKGLAAEKKSTAFTVRFTEEEMARLERYRRSHAYPPTRAAMVQRLALEALPDAAE